MSTDCVFCRILSGEMERSLVAEDEHAIAIMDLDRVAGQIARALD